MLPPLSRCKRARLPRLDAIGLARWRRSPLRATTRGRFLDYPLVRIGGTGCKVPRGRSGRVAVRGARGWRFPRLPLHILIWYPA